MKTKIYDLILKWCSNRISFYAKVRTDVYKNKFFDEFKNRESDIFIVTFFKSGTTWMQMILYQMLHSGEDNFNHIYEVSPWLTNYAITGESADKIEDLPSPRVFKSHDKYKDFDTTVGNKFVFVYRNVYDVLVSMYHHDKNYNNSDITYTQIFDAYFNDKEKYNYFTYLKSWFENKDGIKIIYIKYEDLKTDFDSEIKKIAVFLEVDLTEEKLQNIKEKSSFEYMKANEEKFGEQPKDKRIYNNFIRKGENGEGEILPEDLKKQLETLNNEYFKIQNS